VYRSIGDIMFVVSGAPKVKLIAGTGAWRHAISREDRTHTQQIKTCRTSFSSSLPCILESCMLEPLFPVTANT